MESLLSRYRDGLRRWRRIDRLVRMMIANWIGGMLLGTVFACVWLMLDVAGMRSLLWRSDMPVTGALMLIASFAFTFGGLVCAAAVMLENDDDDRPPRGGRKYRAVRRPQLAYAVAGIRRARG